MTAPRPVSPILDGFVLGEIFSSRDGSICCRAREKSSGEPFVVKMISLPGSARQMEALLMAGAFADRNAANSYYKEQARAILGEARTLQHMAALSCFADFDSVQVVPAEGDNGYEIYLLSPMRTSLQQLMTQPDLSQQQVINMALDICTALASCRHAGFFYADLKPSNVYAIGQNYRIGDLGFLPISTVGHAPLPEQYRSSYTPPEVLAEGGLLNDTADVYALGLMLYQIYNGGLLPTEEDTAGQLLPPPRYADYEMAEIILRACAPDPALRWNDPEQVALALSRYLQRNGSKNQPIISAQLRKMESEKPSPVEPFLPEEYDEVEFRVPLWDIESPGVVESAPVEPPQRRRTEQKAFPHRKGLIAIGILTLVLIVELIVGYYLLRPSADAEQDGTVSTGESQSVSQDTQAPAQP